MTVILKELYIRCYLKKKIKPLAQFSVSPIQGTLKNETLVREFDTSMLH